ncbi:hypothetical protein Ahy_A04g020652 [Arachis hypogaea]|uniref:Uncharacterized protein n=1 Tax=Arachis hypogaea TaxID=3818 RepID=A0A445DIA6_ARAHY|nr:hypothetical protein Ahy_A04g020652 [Arachis hypogaea]
MDLHSTKSDAMVIHSNDFCRIRGGGKIMSTNEDDVKNDSDNDLGGDFDYQSNAEDDAEDDNVDSLDSTSKSE